MASLSVDTTNRSPKQLESETSLTKGDAIKFRVNGQIYFGIYVDGNGIVYAETSEIPKDTFFLKKIYYKLLPQTVKLMEADKIELIQIDQRCKRNQCKITERALLKIDRRTCLNNEQFVEYCVHGIKIPLWLKPAILLTFIIVTRQRNIRDRLNDFLENNQNLIQTMLYGVVGVSLALPVVMYGVGVSLSKDKSLKKENFKDSIKNEEVAQKETDKCEEDCESSLIVDQSYHLHKESQRELESVAEIQNIDIGNKPKENFRDSVENEEVEQKESGEKSIKYNGKEDAGDGYTPEISTEPKNEQPNYLPEKDAKRFHYSLKTDDKNKKRLNSKHFDMEVASIKRSFAESKKMLKDKYDKTYISRSWGHKTLNMADRVEYSNKGSEEDLKLFPDKGQQHKRDGKIPKTCVMNEGDVTTFKVCNDEDEQSNGYQEPQESESEKPAQHTDPAEERTNPSYTKFTIRDVFNLINKNKELITYIETVTKPTAGEEANKTNLDRSRPEFQSKQTYNNTNLRIKCGMIVEVAKFTDGIDKFGNKSLKHTKCCCNSCKYSKSPSNVWWNFQMIAATNVDDNVTSQTSLSSFNDREDSKVIIVDKVSFVNVDIDSDKCIFECVTCDKIMGNKLEKTGTKFVKMGKEISKYLRDLDNLAWRHIKGPDSVRVEYLKENGRCGDLNRNTFSPSFLVSGEA